MRKKINEKTEREEDFMKIVNTRFKDIDRKLDVISSQIIEINKIINGKKNYNIICPNCDHIWSTRSKNKTVSCPSCLHKVKNPLFKSDEPSDDSDKFFNPFEGKRYEDYDDKFMKDLIFKKKKFLPCNICGEKLDYEKGYYGYNQLLCKKHYEEVCKQGYEAVSKMVDKNF